MAAVARATHAYVVLFATTSDGCASKSSARRYFVGNFRGPPNVHGGRTVPYNILRAFSFGAIGDGDHVLDG